MVRTRNVIPLQRQLKEERKRADIFSQELAISKEELGIAKTEAKTKGERILVQRQLQALKLKGRKQKLLSRKRQFQITQRREQLQKPSRFRPIAAEMRRAAIINAQANQARQVFDPMVSGAERAEIWAVTRNEIPLLHNMEAQRNIASTPTRDEEDMGDLAALELPD